MRIHLINRYFHPDHSATSQMASALAFRLAASGHEVHALCSAQRYDDPRADLPAREQVAGVQIHRLRGTRFGRTGLFGRSIDYLSFYLGSLAYLWRALRTGDVLIVKTDPPLLGVALWPLARWRRARLVHWLQDLFPEVAEELLLRGGRRGSLWPLRALRDASLRAADAVVVIGERMAERIRRAGVAPERTRVIHNFADAEALRPIAHDLNPFRPADAAGARWVVGYSGNLGRAHEIDTVLDAIARVPTGAGIRFVFVGGGAQYGALRTEVERRGLGDRVGFRAYAPAERLAASLSAADLHLVVLRPELEGLIVPSKLYGILAVGRPVLFIGSAEGEVAGILARHDCGTTVAVGDGGALAAAIQALADDPQRAQAMGRRARAAFEAHYALDRAVERWCALIDELAQSTP